MELDIVRAWKDDVYRQSLTTEEQALLAENPIGEFELSDTDLETVYGGGCHHRGNGAGRSGSTVYNNSFALLCVQSFLGNCISFSGGCFDKGN
jgi:mersacidin/lichenicidin family type 2 lantibiotic